MRAADASFVGIHFYIDPFQKNFTETYFRTDVILVLYLPHWLAIFLQMSLLMTKSKIDYFFK